MAKPTREQSGLLNVFYRYVRENGTIIHAGFAKDVQALRQYGSSEEMLQPTNSTLNDKSPFIEFVQKYNFPPSMHMFLLHYITHDEIVPEKLSFGVYVVDKSSHGASGLYDDDVNYLGYISDSLSTKYLNLTLAIPVDATNLQIREAIKDARQFIKSRQTELNGGKVKRKRYSVNAELNNWIMERHESGLSPKQILQNLPKKWQGTIHTSQDISDILNHLRTQ